MDFFKMLEEYLASVSLSDVISIIAGILGILVAIIEIILRIKEQTENSHRPTGRSTSKLSHKRGLRIWELFLRKDKSVILKNEALLQEIQPKPSAQKSANIFIGYKVGSFPDEELVDLLRSALEKRGHKPFVHTMLPIGIEWAKALQRHIESSDFLIALLSESSIKSEMLLEEITFAEIHRKKTQHPQLLPIRVQYRKVLPYGLANQLDSKQFALWTDNKDNVDLVSKIISSVETKDEVLLSETIKLVEDEGDKVKPLSSYDPRILEIPSGAVKLQSPFYIRRTCDEEMEQQVLNLGSITTIRAGRQMGKTSLLVRTVDFAKERGYRTVYVDFQAIKSEFKSSLDNLLRYMADEIVYRLNLEKSQLEKVWSSSRGSPDKFGQFLESLVLTDQKQLFLAMDEADQLMDVSFKDEFFSLVRSWDTRRAYDEPWGKLGLAMVISTHPHLLISDYRQSPFNVGLRIQLNDFNLDQVSRLNVLHGSALDDEEILEMMNLLGGHPFLTRQAFYTLRHEKITWSELTKIAVGEQSPFNSHLHFYLWQLRNRPELVSGMREIIRQQMCSDEVVLYRLVSAGLIKVGPNNSCVVRCWLYEDYFRKTLNV